MGISDGALEVASLGSFSVGTFQRPVQRFVPAHDLLPRLAVPGWRGQALPENRSDMTKIQPFPMRAAAPLKIPPASSATPALA